MLQWGFFVGFVFFFFLANTKKEKWPTTRGVGDNLIHRTALLERPRKKRANNIFNSSGRHRGVDSPAPCAADSPRSPPRCSRWSLRGGGLLLSIPGRPDVKCSRSSYRPSAGPTQPVRAETPLPNPCRPAASPRLPPPSEDSLVPEIFNNSRANERGGERMSNDTNSYEPARPDGT